MFKLFRHHHHICQLEFFVQFGFFFLLVIFSKWFIGCAHTKQNGEGDCRRVPDGRSGAQVLRGPLFVLSAAPLHHLHHARWGQFLFLLFSVGFSHHTQNPEPKFFLLCRDSRHVFANEREGTCALKSNRTPPSMVSIDFFLFFCFFFHLLLWNKTKEEDNQSHSPASCVCVGPA